MKSIGTSYFDEQVAAARVLLLHDNDTNNGGFPHCAMTWVKMQRHNDKTMARNELGFVWLCVFPTWICIPRLRVTINAAGRPSVNCSGDDSLRKLRMIISCWCWAAIFSDDLWRVTNAFHGQTKNQKTTPSLSTNLADVSNPVSWYFLLF